MASEWFVSNHILTPGSPVLGAVSGILSAAAAVAVMQPIDTSRAYVYLDPRAHKDVVHAARFIFLREGPTALYRGSRAHFFRTAPHYALMFALLEAVTGAERSALRRRNRDARRARAHLRQPHVGTKRRVGQRRSIASRETRRRRRAPGGHGRRGVLRARGRSRVVSLRRRRTRRDVVRSALALARAVAVAASSTTGRVRARGRLGAVPSREGERGRGRGRMARPGRSASRGGRLRPGGASGGRTATGVGGDDVAARDVPGGGSRGVRRGDAGCRRASREAPTPPRRTDREPRRRRTC